AFDLSLADLEADLEKSESLPSETVDGDLDLNLDFEVADTTEQPVQADPLADFDLDFDAPVSEQPVVEEPTAAPQDDAFVADLEVPADFDLSLADAEAQVDPASDEFLADVAAGDAELSALSSELDDVDIDVEPVPASIAGDADDDFDFLSGTDETATKLALA